MSHKSIHCTLTDQELAAKADQWIEGLIASGGKSFTMQVPARPNADTDLIFAELNNRFKKLVSELQSGPRWVKTGDRLPGWNQPVKWRLDIGDGTKRKIALSEMSDNGVKDILVWQWLDESATATESPAEQPVRGVTAEVFAKYLDEQRSAHTANMWHEKAIWDKPNAFQEWLKYYMQQPPAEWSGEKEGDNG